MEFIGIIPARFASTRFPGKPLADICGMPMIERVYRRAAAVLPQVCVATDDIRIAEAVDKFGGNMLRIGSAPTVSANENFSAARQAERGLEAGITQIIRLHAEKVFPGPGAAIGVLPNDIQSRIANFFF